MNFSGKNGLVKGTSGRFVLSMLLLAWLNIAAQPCLMAMEPSADTSLTSEQTVHSEHNGHASHAPDSANCGHCPPVSENLSIPCETGGASDCEMFPGYNVDGRQFEKLAKDVTPQLALFTLADTVDYSSSVTSFLPHDIKRLKFTGDPPLNIRHCVFLK